jgi:hypothetical protein
MTIAFYEPFSSYVQEAKTPLFRDITLGAGGQLRPAKFLDGVSDGSFWAEKSDRKNYRRIEAQGLTVVSN